MTKVLVYGTLKAGQPNHHILKNETAADGEDAGSATLLFDAITCEQYPLIIATKYNFPILLNAKGLGNNIFGEVYEVDDAKLQYLDVFEDSPNWYNRQVVNVYNLRSKQRHADVHCYLMDDFIEDLLKEDYHAHYDSDGPHGKPVVVRSNRHPDDLINFEWKDIVKRPPSVGASPREAHVCPYCAKMYSRDYSES